jgi:hypothetical protein
MFHLFNHWTFPNAMEKVRLFEETKPHHVEPISGNDWSDKFNHYISTLKKIADKDRNKMLLALQMQASHGIVTNGFQQVVVNAFDYKRCYYELLPIEHKLRFELSGKCPNVYVMNLFACTRELRNTRKQRFICIEP